MAFSFGGEFEVERGREEVYDFLTDPNRFGPLLPDFESLSVEEAGRFTVKVKVGVAHIRGTATVRLQLAEAERPRRALYRGKASVAGGEADVAAGFDLEESSERTRVRWTGQAQIFGPLTSLAGGLLEPLARKNVQKLIDGLQKALS
ncbi:MAG: SRPBCC family protein [Acidobacteria bacterium]|nr:SRPBCC family protein [Acidobacteriota bacterium]